MVYIYYDLQNMDHNKIENLAYEMCHIIKKIIYLIFVLLHYSYADAIFD